VLVANGLFSWYRSRKAKQTIRKDSAILGELPESW